jgi:hypothetical protein
MKVNEREKNDNEGSYNSEGDNNKKISITDSPSPAKDYAVSNRTHPPPHVYASLEHATYKYTPGPSTEL